VVARATGIDLAGGQPPLDLGSRSQVVRLSPDGQYVFGWYGQNLERRRISDGQVTAVPLSVEPSPEDQGYHDDYAPPLVISDFNDRVALATGATTLTIADFSGMTAESYRLFDPVRANDRPTSQALLTLALAPSEGALASVDGTGTLRLWRYPELVQYGPDIPLGVTRGFENCYCALRLFSPVAWSTDERYLATRDQAGATVFRRACDGHVVATLPPFSLPASDFDAEVGPAFIAFTPNGQGLAVLHLTDYFDGVIAYYSLSE
jgi:hypothetical protein